MAAVSGQAITAHIELAEGVYRTEFANGAWAIVNYTATAVTAGETTVPAEGYVTGGY